MVHGAGRGDAGLARLAGLQPATAARTLAEEIEDFIALTQGRPGGRIADAASGQRAVEIANAVYASSATGGVITLPDLA